MAVRTQVYEWTNVGGPGFTTSVGRQVGIIGAVFPPNVSIDIFTGGVGNNITIPPYVRGNQFVVIEDISLTPTLESTLQITVNTTDYFEQPDRTLGGIATGPGQPQVQAGVSGLLSPYPCGAQGPGPGGNAPTADDNSILEPIFKLDPPVYMLPGQKWSMVWTPGIGVNGIGASAAVMIRYKLYDGPDSLIATQILEMGLPVTLNNVNWYKKEILAQINRGG